MIEIANLAQALSGQMQQVSTVQDGNFQRSGDGETLDFQDFMGEAVKPIREEKDETVFAVASTEAPMPMTMPLLMSTSLRQSAENINIETFEPELIGAHNETSQNIIAQNISINSQSENIQNVISQSVTPISLKASYSDKNEPEDLAQAQSQELAFMMPEKEVLKTAGYSPEKPSIFKGISGEVKMVQVNSDEFAPQELGIVIPDNANDVGPLQMVGPDGSMQDINPYDILTPEAQKAVTNDETLTVIQNDAGEVELAPYQSVTPEDNSVDVNVGDDSSTDTTGLLNSKDLSAEEFTVEVQNKEKMASSFVEPKEGPETISTVRESGMGIGETNLGAPTLTSAIRQEIPVEKPQVIDQIYTKMDFPRLKENGEQKISVVLDPQELGRIDVELKMDGDKVNAIFKADHQALNFARNDADKLAQMLKDQGFDASAHNFQFQERTPQESHYAQRERTYGTGFSLEEGGVEAPTAKGSPGRYNVGISGRTYDAVI